MHPKQYRWFRTTLPTISSGEWLVSICRDGHSKTRTADDKQLQLRTGKYLSVLRVFESHIDG